jgi:hypothetical protein
LVTKPPRIFIKNLGVLAPKRWTLASNRDRLAGASPNQPEVPKQGISKRKESEMTEVITENTENQNTENAPENQDNAETTETTESKFSLPKSQDEIDFGEAVIDTLARKIFAGISEIKDIDLNLASQRDEFSDDKLINRAKEMEDNPSVKSVYTKYENTLKRLETMQQELIAQVTEALGIKKMTQEEIDAEAEKRRTLADNVNNFKKTIPPLSNMISDPVKQEYAVWFSENAVVPGARVSSGTSGTSGTGEVPKPRLNGGMVSVGNQNHPNFPTAAEHLSKLTGNEVTKGELINTWISAAGVGNWKDTPADEVFEFDFAGHKVSVLRNSKKSE